MPGKKTTINLTEKNCLKIANLARKTGRTQTDLINQAIAEVPVVVLGNQKDIAECFFELRKAVNSNDKSEICQEVEKTCQSLNLLMLKIREMKPLKME